MHPKGFLDGIGSIPRALRFLAKHRELSRIWRVPLLLMGAGLLTAFVLSALYADDLLELVWRTPGAAGSLGSLARGAHALASFASFVLLLAASVVLLLLFANVLAAPFNDALSERVEHLASGREAPPFSLSSTLKDALRGMALELFKLLVYVAILGPTFVLSLLVPVVGPVLYAAFAFAQTVSYLALDYIDWPASRAGLGVRARLRFVREHVSAMAGLGVGVWVLLWVPLVHLLLMPVAVTAGTLLFLDLRAPPRGVGVT